MNSGKEINAIPSGVIREKISKLPSDLIQDFLNKQTCWNDEKLTEADFRRAKINFVTKQGEEITGFIAGREHDLGIEIIALYGDEVLYSDMLDLIIEEGKKIGKSRINTSDRRPPGNLYTAISNSVYEVHKIDCENADYPEYYISICSGEHEDVNKKVTNTLELGDYVCTVSEEDFQKILGGTEGISDIEDNISKVLGIEKGNFGFLSINRDGNLRIKVKKGVELPKEFKKIEN